MTIYDVNGTMLNTAYDMSGDRLYTAYDIDGASIPIGGSIDYDTYTVTANYMNPSIPNTQGFDVYNGYVFQFRSTNGGNLVSIVDMSTGTVTSTFSLTSDHGDSASFSEEFYSESDEFPLIYISADTNPPQIYVDRITLSSAELKKTLFFPQAQAGYWCSHAYDEENNIMYLVGYTEQNYLTDNGGSNKTKITKWDMSHLTDNGDSTFTPLFISAVERDFIYCMQGQQFRDGMIFTGSGYNGSTESYVYALNPSNAEIIYSYDLGTTLEVEGMAFISDTEMLVGFQGGRYDLYTFAIGGDS